MKGYIGFENVDGRIYIKVMDDASRDDIIKIELTSKNFMAALMRDEENGFAECKFQLDNVDNIGKKRENKFEYLEGITKDDFKNSFKKAIKPFEIDGWKAIEQSNYERYKDDSRGYQVVFVRYI